MRKTGMRVFIVVAGSLLLAGCAQRGERTEQPQAPPGAPNAASEPRSEAGEAARSAGQAAEEAVRGAGQAAENAVLTAKVKNALIITRGIDTSNLNVDTTKDGVVTLRGSVPTAEMKRLVEKTAKNVEGVRAVRNTLSVGAGQAAGAR
jgi:hyperosmotically inducible protein